MKSLFLAVLLLLGVSVMAQTNFSGTWELAKDKSTLNEQFSMAPVKLVISQDGNNLTIERHSEFQGNVYTSESKHTLDGKDNVNSGWQDMKITSVSKWDDAKKKLTISSKIPMQDGGDMKSDQTYSISDGNLSVLAKASSSYGDMEETWVFEKK